jgi:hypothetical protein
MDGANKYFNKFEVIARKMNSRVADESVIISFLKEMFPDCGHRGKFQTDWVRELLSPKEKTIWNLYNSLIEYADFHRGYKPEVRLEVNYVGRGIQFKEKAFEVAYSLCDY